MLAATGGVLARPASWRRVPAPSQIWEAKRDLHQGPSTFPSALPPAFRSEKDGRKRGCLPPAGVCVPLLHAPSCEGRWRLHHRRTLEHLWSPSPSLPLSMCNLFFSESSVYTVEAVAHMRSTPQAFSQSQHRARWELARFRPSGSRKPHITLMFNGRRVRPPETPPPPETPSSICHVLL